MHSRLPVLLAVILLVVTGCSREARLAKSLKAADTWYAAGDLQNAEIEYLNALKNAPGNPRAIARLGLIFLEEGRTAAAVVYLKKAYELLPEDVDLHVKLAQLDLATGGPEDAREKANYVLDHRPLDPEAPLLLASTAANAKDAIMIRARLMGLPAPAPAGAPVLLALGTMELREGRLKEAEEHFKAALAADPKLPAVHSALGTLSLAKKDAAGARAELKLAADLSPARSPRRLQYAQLLISQGDLSAGKQALDEINQKAPDYVPAWITRAEIAIAEKKYPEAEKLIGRAIERDDKNGEARIVLGRVKLAQGKSDEAVAIFEKLAAIYEGLPALQFDLGRAYAAAGEQAKAIAALSRAVNAAPTNADAVLLLASLYMRKGDIQAAITPLRRLVQKRSDLGPAWLMLAEAYRMQGNLDEALAVYRQMEKQMPRNFQLSFLIGQVLAQGGQRDEARQAFLRAQAEAPDNASVLEQLVDLDLAEKKAPAARQRLEAATARNPKLEGPGQLLLAKILLAQNDYVGAEAALKKAIALSPENQTAYFMLAGVYNRTNQLPKALAQLEEAVKLNPKDLSAFMIMGVLRDQQQDYPAARDAYEKVIAINPRSGAALNNLAYLYSEKFGHLDQAEQLAQRARQAAPDEPHVADTLGWILYQKRQYARALPLLQEAADRIPDLVEVQYHLGMAHYMMTHEGEARNALEKALKPAVPFPGADDARRSLAMLNIDVSQPGAADRLDKALALRKTDPVALIRRAEVYEREGKRDDAIRSLEAARDASDQNGGVLASLARLYAARKETAKALELAREARRLAPDDAGITHSLGRLAYDLGDYTWAASLLQEVARKESPSPELLFDLAEASYSIGRVDEAETALRHALESSAVFLNAAEARRLLDFIAWMKNPAEAARQLARVDEALKKDPNDVPALMASGAIGEHRGDATAARQAYEKALDRFPEFSPAKLRLAVLAAAQPNPDQKSYELALQARTAYPADPELARALGILTYRKANFSRAVALLKESAASRGNDAELYFFLGQAQLKLSQKNDGRQSLQHALDAGLAGDAATEARRLLAEK